MAKKTRLLKDHKLELKAEAKRCIQKTVPMFASAKAFKEVMEDLNLSAVLELEKEYPTEDMEVLSKYGTAETWKGAPLDKINTQLRYEYGTPSALRAFATVWKSIQLKHGQRDLLEVKFPLKPGDKIILPKRSWSTPVIQGTKSSHIYKTAKAFQKAQQKLTEEFDEKWTAYYSLIENSRYYEDILEIWPEANVIQGRLQINIPVALSDHELAVIKQDVELRAAS